MTRGQYLALCIALTASVVAALLATSAARAVAAMRNGTPLAPSKIFM